MRQPWSANAQQNSPTSFPTSGEAAVKKRHRVRRGGSTAFALLEVSEKRVMQKSENHPRKRGGVKDSPLHSVMDT